MRSEEEAAYQAAAEAAVASEFGAEVYGLEIRPVDPTTGMEDWQGRCLRRGGDLEFSTPYEKDLYAENAGEAALADRIRRIGMCRLAPLAGYELLTGQPDPFVDPAIMSKIPTGELSRDREDENARIAEYLEQCKEAVRNKWSVVQALAQKLLERRSLYAIEIAELLEGSAT